MCCCTTLTKDRSKNIMIKNIVFDLGNIIIRGTHASIIGDFAKNEEERIYL